MIRIAVRADLDEIAAIYDQTHTEEEAGRTAIGWKRTIYPTRQTAQDAISAEDMFVLETDGRIVAAARINQVQGPEYAGAGWHFDAPEEAVMVLHTLVVSPSAKGLGYGRRFVAFYENYALSQGCLYLRMDTNQRNLAARALYQKLGYIEVDVVPCVFNGICGVQLVCLEKKLCPPSHAQTADSM